MPVYDNDADTGIAPYNRYETLGEQDMRLEEQPSFSQAGAAALRQNNTLTSSLIGPGGRIRTNEPKYVEDGFVAFDQYKGSDLEKYDSRLYNAPNREAYDMRVADIRMQEEDRKVLDRLPWWKRLPLDIGTSLADLPTLVPGGAVYRAANGGYSVGRTALSIGAGAAAGAAIQELALHQSQSIRTVEESAVAIGGSIILGGLLGGGIGALSNRSYNAAVRALDRDAKYAPARLVEKETYDNLILIGEPEEQARATAKTVALVHHSMANSVGEKLGNAYELYQKKPIQWQRDTDGKLRAFVQMDGKHPEVEELFQRSMPKLFPDYKAALDRADADGFRIDAYHATFADGGDFRQFKIAPDDIGVHFGTKGQAEDRFKFLMAAREAGEQGRTGDPRTIPVRLRLNNPLRIDDDLGAWTDQAIAIVLPRTGYFSGDEVAAAMRAGSTPRARLANLRELIKSKGFDGIVYRNLGETQGGEAYRVAAEKADREISQAFPGKYDWTLEEQTHPVYQEWKRATDELGRFREENAEDSFIVFDPGQQVRSVHAEFKAERDAAIRNRPLMYQDATGDPGIQPLVINRILHPDTPAVKANSQDNATIARSLLARAQAALKGLGVSSGKITGPDPITDKIVARAIASEIEDALSRNMSSAVDWYTTKVEEAMSIAALMHPEIASDVNAKMVFTAALSITSQGEKVPSNVRLADIVYSAFKKTGKFPTRMKFADPSIAANLKKFNSLYKAMGPERLREFLSRESTVGELRSAGFKIGGENVDTRVYGSAIFGPKIGQGFYQNLNGNYTPLTMDLWFMRAWGRLTGTLMDTSTEAGYAAQRQRFETALKKARQPVPKRIDALYKIAEQILSRHEKDYRINRSLYKSGKRKKSKLTYAAERLIHGRDALRDVPGSGGERIWMRDVMGQARVMLAERGINLTPADMQAVWWYPEKHLYAKLGGRAANLDIDYSTAFGDLARSKGVDNATIERTRSRVVQPLERAAGSGRGDVGGTARSLSEKVAQTDGAAGRRSQLPQSPPRDEGGLATKLYQQEAGQPPASSLLGQTTNSREVLYHGTSKDKDFSKFKEAKNGTWFTIDPAEASQYAVDNDSMKVVYDPTTHKYVKQNTASRVIPVYHNFENTLVLQEWPEKLKFATNYKRAQSEYFAELRAQGYDSVRFSTGDGKDVVVSLDNSKLSPIWRGELKQGMDSPAPRGMIDISDPSKSIITLFEKADVSTIQHELAHHYLEMMKELGSHGAASKQFKQDLKTIYDWLGVKSGDEITTAHHEKFAGGWERYLAEGKAPSSALVEVFERFKQWMLDIYREVASAGVPITDDVRAVFNRMLSPEDAEFFLPRRVDVGAAAVEAASLQGNAIAGRMAGAVASATQRLNPLLRVLHSPSAVVREIGMRLFENPTYLVKNYDGVASEAAVETLMKEYNGHLGRAAVAHDKAYRAHWDAGGRMSKKEFNEAVGVAMRNDDEGADAAVSQAAKAWRSTVFDPLKEAAIKANLLPEDVSVETAKSYFSRMWDRNKLFGNEPEFKRIVTEYYNDLLVKEYQKSKTSLDAKIARIEQEIADLQLTPEQRASTLGELDERIRAIEAMAPDQLAQADRLSDLRSDMRAAKKAGDDAAYKASKAEFDRIMEEGGPTLKEFIDQRAGMRTRRKNVDYGDAGVRERADAILGQIADIEERNYREMERLVKKGQKLERDLNRLDADAREEQINALADQYAALAKRQSDLAERTRKQVENIQKRAASATSKPEKEAAVASAEATTAAPEQVAAKRAEAAAAREKIDAVRAEADAKIAAKLMQEADRFTRLSEQMDQAGERLRLAVDFDHDSLMAEVKGAIESAMRAASARSMARGERIAGLAERMARWSPERVQARIKALDAMRRDAEIAHYTKWEVRNLGEGVGTADPDFREMSREIADNVFNTLTGRHDGGPRPEFMTVNTRGPMKDRTFNIPDRLVEQFLNNDVAEVGARYIRVMGADVELARKFGSPDMVEQLAKITESYDRLRALAETPEERLALSKAEKADKDDLAHVRDMLRGTRYMGTAERNSAKALRSLGYFNYLRLMGEVVLSSISEIVRPIMTHGLGEYMRTVGQLTTNLKSVKMAVEEARLAGTALERILAERLMTLAEINDPFASRGPTEALLHNMSNFASKWNGIRLFTEMEQAFASVMTQNRILRGVTNYANISPKEKAYLAFVGIDEDMASRIAGQFAKHGENADGVHVANTLSWDISDPAVEQALRAYRAAINKDVDSTVVKKGVADVPVFATTPFGQALTQFRTFALASHQRVLLRGLQEDQSRFVSGLVAMTAMGMMATWLKALTGNRTERLQDPTKNPGWWIAEGLDKTGVLSIPMEVANTMEKATGFNPIKTPIKAFDEGSAISQKNQNKSIIGSLIGPTAGLIDDAATVAGIPNQLRKGEPVTKGQANAGIRLVPGNSYPGFRSMIGYTTNNFQN